MNSEIARRLMRAVLLATLCLVTPRSAPGQTASILHVKVVLLDAEGRPTPVPRHALLVSDNPPTVSPRKVVTGLDGAVDVKLRPGSYIVESDEPVVFSGKAYRWTRMLELPGGRDVTLELTTENADVEDATAPAAPAGTAPPEDDPSFLLSRWQDSVVSLWTPTSRALGFVAEAGGLVATSRRAIGAAASADVQLSPTVKVTGRVLLADATSDVAVLWIAPTVVASVRPVPLDCAATPTSPVAAGQEVFAIDGSLRGQRSLAPGTVTRVDTNGLLVDFRVEPRSAGGPVFAADGGVVGITSLADEVDRRRRGDSRIVPVADVCQILRAAAQKTRGTAPPSATLLPVEPARPFPLDALEDAARHRAGASPYQLASSDFDISFITPQLVYAAQHRWAAAGGPGRGTDVRWSDPAQDRLRLLTDFGSWSEYVADVPPVLLVRVTPRFVEGFWTMVGRGAAYTQGVSIPPIKRFKPGFSRMRAFCGASEVTPIHAFTVEQRVSEDDAIREGLYAFDPGALGPSCRTVKLVLFSEKAPDKGDSKVVDPGVLEQVWRDFAPYRAAAPEGARNWPAVPTGLPRETTRTADVRPRRASRPGARRFPTPRRRDWPRPRRTPAHPAASRRDPAPPGRPRRTRRPPRWDRRPPRRVPAIP
jgi:hypothetical protein